jgi:uncharacterized protein (DUF305 family)
MAVPETTAPPRPARGPQPPRALVAALVGVAAAATLMATVVVLRQRAAPDAAPRGGAAPATLVTDPVDVGFATDMLDHHQQALQMALLAVDKATTTPVRSLAVKMVAAQQLESGRFLQYLEERGRHQGDPDREVMAWMGMARPRAQMPGLASPDQLVALTNATGGEVDRQFVELMLRHHEGGLHMAEYAAGHGTNEALRGVAGRMVVMQRREIADLEQLQAGLR